jgi:hypothetical protein
MFAPRTRRRNAVAAVALGSGTGVDATDTMRRTDVQRTMDGAFVTLSYVYRVRGMTR